MGVQQRRVRMRRRPCSHGFITTTSRGGRGAPPERTVFGFDKSFWSTAGDLGWTVGRSIIYCSCCPVGCTSWIGIKQASLPSSRVFSAGGIGTELGFANCCEQNESSWPRVRTLPARSCVPGRRRVLLPLPLPKGFVLLLHCSPGATGRLGQYHWSDFVLVLWHCRRLNKEISVCFGGLTLGQH
jgi:hypothetical protein